MQKLILLFLLYSSFVFSQNTERDVLKYQKELNTFYLNKDTSPLKEEELKEFKGIRFYGYDKNFVVNARLERLERQSTFEMPTSGKLKPLYRRFGILYFTINSQPFQLEVYQNIDLMKRKGYEKHLFLPFIDLTSGNETYGGGRYLDIEIPDSDELILDFNKAYHPYCAYTYRYSCPITPDVNFINAKVSAGVKF